MNYFSSNKTRGFSLRILGARPRIFFFGAREESLYLIMKAQRKNIFGKEKYITQQNALPF